MDGTGVAARSGITCSTMGEGGREGDDGGCGTGGRGDSGTVWGSTDGEWGEGGADSRISASVEGRGDDDEAGLGSEISLTTSSSLNMCTSSSWGNSSSNKAEAGGHSGITTSTGGGGGTITASTAAAGGDGGGGGVLGIEAGLGGRSVGTSKLDDESETIKVDNVGGGSTKDSDDVTIGTSSESVVVGGSGLSGGSTPTGVAGVV